MQRIIEENLLTKKKEDAVTYAIQYVSENAEEIIIQDLQEILYT